MFKAAALVSIFALHAAVASAALLPSPSLAGPRAGGLQKRAIQDNDWKEVREIVNSRAARAIAIVHSRRPKDGFCLGSAVLQTTSQLRREGTISQGASFDHGFHLRIDVPDNIITEAVLDVLPRGVAQLSERDRVPALNRLLTYALLRFTWPTPAAFDEWFDADMGDDDLPQAFDMAIKAASGDSFVEYAYHHGVALPQLEDLRVKLVRFLGWFAGEVSRDGLQSLAREVPNVLEMLDPDMMKVLYLYFGFVHGYGNCKTSRNNRYIKPRYKYDTAPGGFMIESGADSPQKLLSSLTARPSLTNLDGLLTTRYDFSQKDDMTYFLTAARQEPDQRQ